MWNPDPPTEPLLPYPPPDWFDLFLCRWVFHDWIDHSTIEPDLLTPRWIVSAHVCCRRCRKNCTVR